MARHKMIMKQECMMIMSNQAPRPQVQWTLSQMQRTTGPLALTNWGLIDGKNTCKSSMFAGCKATSFKTEHKEEDNDFTGLDWTCNMLQYITVYSVPVSFSRLSSNDYFG